MHSFDQSKITIAGIAASLRQNSFNRRLIEAARQRTPSNLHLGIVEGLGEIPLFNEDLEQDGGPAAVRRLVDAIGRADAVLIATPEYNQSVPGVTKNLIDWLSRANPAPIEGKPVAIMGASGGPWGTRLAQAALRQTLAACGALVMPQPQLYVRSAGEVFDADGALVDRRVSSQLSALLAAFGQWISINNANTRERTQ